MATKEFSREDEVSRPDLAFAAPPHWPCGNGLPLVFLLDTSSRLEKKVLRRWILDECPKGRSSHDIRIIDLPPSRRSRPRRERSQVLALETLLASGEEVLLVPLRIAWDRERRPGVRANPVRELLTIGDPRDPGALRQRWIRRNAPHLCRVVLAEPASTQDLRSRWCEHGDQEVIDSSSLSVFVERQASLALERAERRLRGQRYKVPKLVREDIISRSGFREGIARLAGELGQSASRVAGTADRYVREMAATHSPHVIDLCAHLIHLLYSKGYGESLHYDRDRLEEVYALGQRYPLIFLPSHKSNLDHLVLQYALYENGHPPNHTAGGINMNFFPVGPLVRRSGVFFIRRSFKDNPLYKFVLRQYIDYLIEKRFSLEWYIEGGRSRSGKLLAPRLGLLTYAIESWARGRAEDVFLIPVSIAYDQIQDVGDYVAEQRGESKSKESFSWLLRMLRSVRSRYGNIYINFGDPVSVRESLGSPLEVAKAPQEERNLATQKVAFDVAVRIDRVTPITATSLVTLSLLGVGGRALSLAEARETLEPLLAYVERRNLPVTDEFDLASARGLQRALEALSDSGVVVCFADGPDPVYRLGVDQHLTAAYYRNTIIHFFVSGAIAELALLASAEVDPPGRPEALQEAALRMRDLLKFEFFFPEKDEFYAELLADLEMRSPEWQKALPGGEDEIRGAVRRLRPLLSHRVLRPFLESYRVVADALEESAANEEVDEGTLIQRCMGLGQQYLLQRRLQSLESVSRVLFQSGVDLARNRGLIEGKRIAPLSDRKEFAREVRESIRRIDAIESVAAGRRAGFIR